MSLYIYTDGDTGIMAMDSVTGSIYFEYAGVDRHHPDIRNTHSVFPSSQSYALLPSFRGSTQYVSNLTLSCQLFIDRRISFGSSRPGIRSYPLTLFLRYSTQNHSLSRIPFGYHARCCGVLMMGCLTSSSSVSPHRDQLNLEMLSNAGINRVWRCTWKAVIMRTWRPYSSELGVTPGGCD